MDISVGVKHEGAYLTLRFSGVSISGGHTRHPPEVRFDDVKITNDEAERDLDAEEVFCTHDSYFSNELLARGSKRKEERKSAYYADRVDELKDEGRL